MIAAPVPKKKGGLGMLLVQKKQFQWVLLSEDGKTERELSEFGRDQSKNKGFHVCISPDGQRIAWACNVSANGRTETRLCVRDVDGEGVGTVDELNEYRWPLEWVGNQRLYTNRSGEPKDGKGKYQLVDATTWESEPFDAKEGGSFHEASADGQTWLLIRCKPPPPQWQYRVWSLRDAKGEVTTIQEDGDDRRVTQNMAISPDGGTVVYSRIDTHDETLEGEHVDTIFVRKLTDAKAVKVDKLPALAIVTSLCWAADGKRFAYTWKEYDEKKMKWQARGICTQNADGSGLNQIMTCPADWKQEEWPRVACWR
jgi:hypothetical protein